LHGVRELVCAAIRLRRSGFLDWESRALGNQAQDVLGTEKRVRRESGFASVFSYHPVLSRVAHAFVPDGCDLIPGKKQI
jgi:hypothetical protein